MRSCCDFCTSASFSPITADRQELQGGGFRGEKVQTAHVCQDTIKRHKRMASSPFRHSLLHIPGAFGFVRLAVLRDNVLDFLHLPAWSHHMLLACPRAVCLGSQSPKPPAALKGWYAYYRQRTEKGSGGPASDPKGQACFIFAP